MYNLLFKQSKKSRILTLYIVSSLLISENALGEYGKPSISVFGPTDRIQINFKFFDYEPIHGVENSYLKSFEVHYSTTNPTNITHLISALTENQKSKTWAWIEFKDKKRHEKIDIILTPMNQLIDRKTQWDDGYNINLPVSVNPINKTSVSASIVWYPQNIVRDNIHILIKAKWYNSIEMKTEVVSKHYVVIPLHPKLKSNNSFFSNSSPKQVISAVKQNNSVKAYKEANAIVIEGALNEKIDVFTISGVLVNSMPANSEVFPIPLPADQLYIVNVAQGTCKVAL